MFSCVAAPEMIQYYLELGISSENLIETYWRMFHRSTVPVGAGAVLIFTDYNVRKVNILELSDHLVFLRKPSNSLA